jgi:hypothetical protein
MKIINIFILFTLCLPNFAKAEGGMTGAGDGGHGVLCLKYERGRRYRVELLDLFESRRLYDLSEYNPFHKPFDASTLRGSVDSFRRELREKQKVLLRTLKNSDSVENINYIFAQANMVTTKFNEEDEVIDTADHGALQIRLPKFCKIVQLAAHRIGKDGEVVMLNRDVAELLNHEEIAALLLHETMHSIFGKMQSTLVIRQFVTFVFAPEWFQRKNLDQFELLVSTQQPVIYRSR